MNRRKTFYDLFEISSRATNSQIRAAYVRLMKRHHPDVADGPATPASFLALIGRGYKTLSDPMARATYDAELARSDGAHDGSPGRWVAQPASRASRRSPWLGGIAAAGVAAIAIVALFEQSSREPKPGEKFQQALRWLHPQAMSVNDSGPPRLTPFAAIRREARRATQVSLHEALARSNSCFGAARDRESTAAAQLCVVFDHAFLYSQKAPLAALPPYFNPTMVRLRHSSALGVAPSDPLLERLWSESFTALMADGRDSRKGLAPKSPDARQARPGGLAPLPYPSQKGTIAQP